MTTITEIETPAPQNPPQSYCDSLTAYSRYQTREVQIGDVALGAQHPIRVQSMTTTDTMDTLATIEQSVRIIEAGADYVRITAPSLNEARNLEPIKAELRRRGYDAPLIADIHYTPNAAEFAARIVEKVRVNPGNYVDKKRFQIFEYSDEEYAEELDRIRERFTPLVNVCKEYGTALRIGTNHGSLSDRIMNRFGDTPLGMVESALEFVRICEDLGYYNIVLSMKASNTRVMVQAYRLLVQMMEAEDMNYPIHLGVTEAGDGEDGRTKSAVGIGALLEDGIGDTIRVSLTEEPEAEVPVAIELVQRVEQRPEYNPIPPMADYPVDPFFYTRRKTVQVENIGKDNVPVIVLTANADMIQTPEALSTIGYEYDPSLDKWNIGDAAADFITLGKRELSYALPGTLKKICDHAVWLDLGRPSDAFPLFDMEAYVATDLRSDRINFVEADLGQLNQEALRLLSRDARAVLVLRTTNTLAMAELRRAFVTLIEDRIDCPVIIKRIYPELGADEFLLHAAADVGGLLTDGLGDGVWFEAPRVTAEAINRISFGLLQATRTRISRTEYISCPSCGRTLFDLQKTTAVIRNRTNHLKGVKIGIMGCIVNGPGEMADADYGYVGSGPGQITLYRGQEIVKRNISTEIAVDELINLVKQDNRWIDP